MSDRPTDRYALNGKLPAPDALTDLLVVGAGRAGTAAAIAAARAGRKVLLVDENPVDPALLRADVPLWYGMRMTGAVDHAGAMTEALLAANPDLETAFALGVDVQLGVTAWGLYVPVPGLATLPRALVGLADHDRSWMVGFDELMLATGSRDLALAFPGWDQPGVMGARGFAAMLRLGAFSGQRVAIVGGGALADRTATLAADHGIAIAAMILNPVALRATGTAEGVTALATGDGRTIACDTVVLAVGQVAMIELAAAAGAATVGGPQGRVLVTGADGATSLPGVHVMGSAAGASGDIAAVARWANALAAGCTPDMVVCQCEEVTMGDLTGVQPPRYLDAPIAGRDLATLLADGPADQDQIKRLTRAGMGLCQGRRCRETVSLCLARAEGIAAADAPFTGYRAPVRPLPLGVLAAWDEAPDMAAGWDVWFGIAQQWTPYAAIDTPDEARHIAILGGDGHV